MATVPLILLLSVTVNSQTRTEQLGAIPPKLRPALAQRLNEFSDAQRTADWQKVSNLLGKYFYGLGWKRTKYSPPQKAWMVETLKQKRMLSFTAEKAGYSTDILSLPFSLKYWIVDGHVRYSESLDARSLPMILIAYRENGQWYLSPFVRNECGELRLPNVPDFSAMSLSEQHLPALSLLPQPDLPIEILDLVVEDVGDIRCSMLRKVNFRVRNKTKKTVDGYIFNIQTVGHVGSEGDGLSTGTPNLIVPGETAPNRSATAFTSYRPQVLWFSSVSFTDGTSWRATASRRKTPKHRKR